MLSKRRFVFSFAFTFAANRIFALKDRQKAKEFYLKLGYHVIAEAPAAHGETWIQMGLPGGNTSISLASFHGIICDTDDIEKEIQDLTTQGIKVGKDDQTPWGNLHG
jgi:hypothetical protein